MSVYLDTSVLTPYYVKEAGTKRTQRFLIAHPQPAVSWLTEVELFSSVARKVREDTLSEADARKVLLMFRSQLAGGYFRRLAIQAQHYQLASDWIETFKSPLRTLDALHLAVAATENLPLATSDKALAQAAKRLGTESILV